MHAFGTIVASVLSIGITVLMISWVLDEIRNPEPPRRTGRTPEYDKYLKKRFGICQK
jgi:hypothetical protein